MEQIIDVEYKEVVDLNSKTTEDLCQEVNLYWNQMELLGKLGFEFAARAGQRLNIIKGRLQHGEWEDWCKKNLSFSARKANRMMKLAEKMSDEDSLFFKSDNLSDIGISKVWELLAAPEEVAEEVINNPDAADMSVRELKEEKEEKNRELESMECKRQEAETKAEEMEESANRLSEEIVNLEQKLKDSASSEEADKLKQELVKQKEKLKKAKSDADSQRVVAVEAAKKAEREKAETEAKAKYEETTRQLKESNQQAAKEIDRLQKIAGSNTELAIFKVKSEQLQQDFNACLTSIIDIEADNQEQGAKLRNALRMVMEKLLERIEE